MIPNGMAKKVMERARIIGMIAAAPIPVALAVGARPGLFKKGSQKNKVVHSGRGIMKGRGG